MRCGEAIPPESLIHTADGANAVTIHVRSRYKALEENGMHGWSYSRSVNEGCRRFSCSRGTGYSSTRMDSPVKGPGARGTTVLKPHERFEYKSGTRLLTARGSVHGWFASSCRRASCSSGA